MSLTRKFLGGMGLTAEQVDAIIEEHSTTVDSLKEQRDEYKQEAESLKDVQKAYDKLKKQVEDGAGDATEWQDKYEKEHKAFEEFKKAEAKKVETEAIKEAYTKLLKAAGVSEKCIPSILECTNYDGMKLDAEGNLEEGEKHTTAIKERWGGFITEVKTGGADVETPPKGGANKYESKEEIMKIRDASERQAAIKNNPQLFE